MGETGKTVLIFVGIVAGLEALKHMLGTCVSFSVALAALAFCIGALWGAGKDTPPPTTRGG